MRRALAQGGRLALATWRSDDESPFFRELRIVAERHLGAIDDQRFSFEDAALLEALLRDTGFHDIQVKTISRMIGFNDGEPFLRLNTMAYVGMSAAGKAMEDAERQRVIQAIISESVPVLQRYGDGSQLTFELRINLATAKESNV